ncbi:hypothetical protein GCM10027214_34000 [Stenotrophomonas tumulicola]
MIAEASVGRERASARRGASDPPARIKVRRATVSAFMRIACAGYNNGALGRRCSMLSEVADPTAGRSRYRASGWRAL